MAESYCVRRTEEYAWCGRKLTLFFVLTDEFVYADWDHAGAVYEHFKKKSKICPDCSLAYGKAMKQYSPLNWGSL